MKDPAVKAFERIKLHCDMNNTSPILIAELRTVYQALKRNNEMHPVPYEEDWGTEWYCPNCDEPIDDEEPAYCRHCGQSLTYTTREAYEPDWDTIAKEERMQHDD